MNYSIVDWHKEGFPTARAKSFPPKFSIASGTSTGKTALALAFASQLILEAKTVCIVVPAGLVYQWKKEHAKFAIQLRLPKLNIVEDISIHKEKEDQINLVCAHYFSTGSERFKSWKKKWLEFNWSVIIFDEAGKIPRWAALLPLTYCFTLNASLLSQKVITNVRVDKELGTLPDLHVDLFIVNQIKEEITSGIANQPIIFASKLWLERLAEGKTLVLSNDSCRYTKKGKFMEPVPVAKHLHSPRVNFEMARGSSPMARSKIVQDFVNSKFSDAVLLGTVSSLKRGFNLPCETLVILALREQLGAKTLLQIVGRVQRVQTGIKTVKIKIVTYQKISGVILSLCNQYRNVSTIVKRAERFTLDTLQSVGKRIEKGREFDCVKYSFLTPSKKDEWVPPIQPIEFPSDLIALPKPKGSGWKIYNGYSFELKRKEEYFIGQILFRPKKTQPVYVLRTKHIDSCVSVCTDIFHTSALAIKAFKVKFFEKTKNHWKGRGMFFKCPHHYDYNAVPTNKFYYKE